MLYTETVEAGTLDPIKSFICDEVFNDFNWVGGAALRLKLGHRRSIDIDLFTNKDFDAKSIKLHLEDCYKVEKAQNAKKLCLRIGQQRKS
jgi:hypothetical protein